MYIDVGIEATACAHSADKIRYEIWQSWRQKRGILTFVAHPEQHNENNT